MQEDLCHIEPTKLLLESIGRGFFYNYSCEGQNAAGWGPRSEDKELMVSWLHSLSFSLTYSRSLPFSLSPCRCTTSPDLPSSSTSR